MSCRDLVSDGHSADHAQRSRKCCCDLQQWRAGTAPHLAAPQSFRSFFLFGFDFFSSFQLKWSFGVSERFFVSRNQFFQQPQDEDTCRTVKTLEKCRSISTACKTSSRSSASRTSQLPASAFVVFCFCDSHFFHLSFSPSIVSFSFFFQTSQLFGVIDEQGNIPIVLRLPLESSVSHSL